VTVLRLGTVLAVLLAGSSCSSTDAPSVYPLGYDGSNLIPHGDFEGAARFTNTWIVTCADETVCDSDTACPCAFIDDTVSATGASSLFLEPDTKLELRTPIPTRRSRLVELTRNVLVPNHPSVTVAIELLQRTEENDQWLPLVHRYVPGASGSSLLWRPPVYERRVTVSDDPIRVTVVNYDNSTAWLDTLSLSYVAPGSERGVEIVSDPPVNAARIAVTDGGDTPTFCAVTTSGGVECWGGNRELHARPPEGAFVDIVGYRERMCGLRESGTLECWGTPSIRPLPTVPLQQISAGCGLDSEGALVCWDVDDEIVKAPGGPYRQISIGGAHACGILTTGEIECWGAGTEPTTGPCWPNCGQAVPPSDSFLQVSAGTLHTCAVRDDGSVACWGAGSTVGDCHAEDVTANECGQAIPPSGSFATVVAGGLHSCGIRADGTLACWGAGSEPNDPEYVDVDVRQAQPPAGEFTSLTAHGSGSCAVRADGEVMCWGKLASHLANSPLVRFAP
jgi:hypothetical protein